MSDKVRGFRLGDRVQFTSVLERDPPTKEGPRRWYSVESSGTGLVVGHRVVFDGVTREESEYDGFRGQLYSWREFDVTDSTPCLLIATGMRRAHVRAPLSSVTLLGRG